MSDSLTLADRSQALRQCSPQFEPRASGASRLSGAAGAIVRRWLDRSLEPMRRAHRRRHTIRELSHLDDRALADIGLSRADITRVADISARYVPEGAMSAAELRRRHP